jgi:hypothetical protein
VWRRGRLTCLADASPDRYRPALARSLHNLDNMLSALGRPAEAEAARNEALAIQTSGVQ